MNINVISWNFGSSELFFQFWTILILNNMKLFYLSLVFLKTESECPPLNRDNQK